MRFKKCEYKGYHRKKELFNFLMEFKSAGIKCAVVEDWNYSSAEVGARSINACSSRYGLHIIARTQKGQIYLINELLK